MFHSPPRPHGRSRRSLLSRSFRGATPGTSVPPAECDKKADRGGSTAKGIGPVPPGPEATLSPLHLRRTTHGLPPLPEDLVPMETTGSQQCGTGTEQQRLSRSSLCSPAPSSALFLFSW